jgi:hypothetical protein
MRCSSARCPASISSPDRRGCGACGAPLAYDWHIMNALPSGDDTLPHTAPGALRGDRLLRAVIDALQAAGYVVDERRESDRTSALLVHRGGPVLVTHLPQRRCFQVEFLATLPADAPRSERTLYWYYHAHQPGDLARIATGLAAAVCGQAATSGA